MADAKKDGRTLTIKNGSGEDLSYPVSDMGEEERILYNKIELISTDALALKANANFKLENADILQKYYLGQLTALLNKESDEQGLQGETEGDTEGGVQGGST